MEAIHLSALVGKVVIQSAFPAHQEKAGVPAAGAWQTIKMRSYADSKGII
jgi:hypothetical protein